jgi:hypothetical protein
LEAIVADPERLMRLMKELDEARLSGKSPEELKSIMGGDPTKFIQLLAEHGVNVTAAAPGEAT